MKVVVIGGTGLIGKKLVNKLIDLEHEVVAASPATGVNAVTGEGLSQALSGAEVVVDVSNSPSWEDKAVLDFFESSTKNLLEAEGLAGVKHHIALSVVGTDKLLQSGYFRAKMAQEELIQASNIPHTILRSTQFFEFLNGIAQSASEGQAVRLPTAFIQPVFSEDVAAALVDVVIGAPINGIVDLAGPDRFPLYEVVRQYLIAIKDTRQVIPDVEAPYFGIKLNETSLVPTGVNPILGPTRLNDWLAIGLAL
jgi:uncharacterized protein YbjT (DUF2867 family)